MTRSDLVEELANRFGQLTHRDAEFAVKAILDAMNDALGAGHRIAVGRCLGLVGPPPRRSVDAPARGDAGRAAPDGDAALQYAKTIICEWVNPFLSELLQSGA